MSFKIIATNLKKYDVFNIKTKDFDIYNDIKFAIYDDEKKL